MTSDTGPGRAGGAVEVATDPPARAIGRTKAALRAWRSAGRDKRSTPPPTIEGMLDDAERAIVSACLPYSMVGCDRLVAVIDAVRHVTKNRIAGALVECGVYRGGATLAALLTLAELGADDRDVFLYDTFEGMTEPTEVDTSPFEAPARSTWERARAAGKKPWNYWFNPEFFSRDAVESTVLGSGYPPQRIHLVEGPVEATIPTTAPPSIAVLRLDTDWYESTRHELEHLYPRLSPGGVLIVDDYGHWEGARRAVDEYFDRHGSRPLLTRTDYTGRMGVKPLTSV